ncbi:hypothetical protein PENTCL1PPCAC_21639, partial [Pristionchus entomophagus]
CHCRRPSRSALPRHPHSAQAEQIDRVAVECERLPDKLPLSVECLPSTGSVDVGRDGNAVRNVRFQRNIF